MRNAIFTFCAVFSFQLLANSVEDAVVFFSTVGPDTYADGTAVLDGESYALVWSNDGGFDGFSADGKALDRDDKVLAVASVAKEGRLPKTAFQIPAADAVNSGSYEVFLLDTRVVSSSGEIAPRRAQNGETALVNGYGKVAADISLSSVKSKSQKTAVANFNSAAPKNVRQPRIRSMRIEGGEVVLTVENSPGFMRVHSGKTPLASDATTAAIETESSEENLTITVPKVGDKGFYRVIRNERRVQN